MTYSHIILLLISCVLAYFLKREVKRHNKTIAELRAERMWIEMQQEKIASLEKDLNQCLKREKANG